MKTEYDTDTAFLYPITGKTGTPLYIPSCYAIEAKKRLATSGFAGVFLPEIRIYAYPRQMAFYCVTYPQQKEC